MPVRFNDAGVFPIITNSANLADGDTLLIYDLSATMVKQVQMDALKAFTQTATEGGNAVATTIAPTFGQAFDIDDCAGIHRVVVSFDSANLLQLGDLSDAVATPGLITIVHLGSGALTIGEVGTVINPTTLNASTGTVTEIELAQGASITLLCVGERNTAGKRVFVLLSTHGTVTIT